MYVFDSRAHSLLPHALYSASEHYLVACSVVWLTPAEAQSAAHSLLFRSAVAIEGVAPRPDGRQAYRAKAPLLRANQVQAYLDRLTQARIEMGTQMWTVRDTGAFCALQCWGYPLVVRNWQTGGLAAHPSVPRSFLTSGILGSVRRNVVLTMLADCLADEFGVPVQALLLSRRELSQARHRALPVALRQGSLLFMQGLARLAPLKSERGGSALGTRLLKGLLAPDVARLARQATHSSFSLNIYNQVRAHLPTYARVQAQTPALLPVLHSFVRALPQTLREGQLLGACELVSREFDGARQAFLAQAGASKSAWKYLLRVPRSAVKACVSRVEAFSREDLSPSQALALALVNMETLQTFWRVGVPVEQLSNRARFAELQALWRPLRPGAGPDIPLELLRRFSALWVSMLPAARDRRFPAELSLEARRVLDWLLQEGFAQGHPRVQDSWFDVYRRSREWHFRVQANRSAAEHERWQRTAKAMETVHAANFSADGLGWDGVVSGFEWRGLRASPLRTSQALWDEHVLMRHCVDTYLQPCWSGSSRLFHLQDPRSRRRRSTLELVRGAAGSWEIRQHEGPCGQAPHPTLLPLAEELLRRARAEST